MNSRVARLPARVVTLLLAAALVLAARGASAEVLFGVLHDVASPYTSTLITFDSSSPGTILSSTLVTGLELGGADQFTITGIDFRPSTLQLYGLADRSGHAQRAYQINPDTGAATRISTAPFISGTSFGFDADPVSDMIRTTSDVTSNFSNSSNNRLNPDTGAIIQDVRFSFAAGDPNFGDNPQILSAAYTNSVSGASATTLYGIDARNDVLVRIGAAGSSTSANSGVLITIGPLGLSFDLPVSPAGMEISPFTGVAYATIMQGVASHLYSLDLSTGATTDLGVIGTGAPVYDLTTAIPEASATLLVGLALAGAIAAPWCARRLSCGGVIS